MAKANSLQQYASNELHEIKPSVLEGYMTAHAKEIQKGNLSPDFPDVVYLGLRHKTDGNTIALYAFIILPAIASAIFGLFDEISALTLAICGCVFATYFTHVSFKKQLKELNHVFMSDADIQQAQPVPQNVTFLVPEQD